MLESLSRLVDKSLVAVREEGGETRYRLLETVRQYGREKLEESGEEAEVGRRHARYCVGLAEYAERELGGPDQARWLVRLEAEHDNIRAALSFSLGEGGEVGSGVRLAAALWPFWFARGYLSEGRRWLESAVTRTGPATTLARAKALNGAGWLAAYQGEYGAAKALIEEGLALYRGLGDKEGIASSLVILGSVAAMGQRDDIPVADLVDEAIQLKPELKDRRTLAQLLVLEGRVALARGDLERSVELWEETLALYREARDALGTVMCLTNIALLALAQGELRKVRHAAPRRSVSGAGAGSQDLHPILHHRVGERGSCPGASGSCGAAVGGRGRHERDLRRPLFARRPRRHRLRGSPRRRALATGRGAMDRRVGRGTGDAARAGRRVRVGARDSPRAGRT